jgi:hypothetical protein
MSSITNVHADTNNISRFNPPTMIKNNVSAAHSGHKIRLFSTKVFNCSFIHSTGLQSEQEAVEEDREMTDCTLSYIINVSI